MSTAIRQTCELIHQWCVGSQHPHVITEDADYRLWKWTLWTQPARKVTYELCGPEERWWEWDWDALWTDEVQPANSSLQKSWREQQHFKQLTRTVLTNGQPGVW